MKGAARYAGAIDMRHGLRVGCGHVVHGVCNNRPRSAAGEQHRKGAKPNARLHDDPPLDMAASKTDATGDKRKTTAATSAAYETPSLGVDSWRRCAVRLQRDTGQPPKCVTAGNRSPALPIGPTDFVGCTPTRAGCRRRRWPPRATTSDATWRPTPSRRQLRPRRTTALRSAAAFGCRAAIRSRARAGPSGRRRPVSRRTGDASFAREYANGRDLARELNAPAARRRAAPPCCRRGCRPKAARC